MKPRLAELLNMENPYSEAAFPRRHATYGGATYLNYGEEAYNRALEDAGERMHLFKVPDRSYIMVEVPTLNQWVTEEQQDGPGYWAWIPERVEPQWHVCSGKGIVESLSTGGIEFCPSCRGEPIGELAGKAFAAMGCRRRRRGWVNETACG